MKSERNFVYFLRNLREKHRLSLRNQHNDSEVWYMYISPANVLTGFVALVLVLFIVILTTVAYTPILDLIPGYPGNKSREMLISNIVRIDSLERELAQMQVYSDNIALIMEGKTPIVRDVTQAGDSMRVSRPETVHPSREDSLLRAELEGGGIYRLSDPAKVRTVRTGLELMPPVRGVVAEHFNPKEERFGVGIATAASQQVMAVEDGTVVLSAWSPDDGYVVQIQHPGNLLSVYKHATRVLPSTGARVKGGEVIGSTGEGLSGDAGKGLFGFELWHNGTPVDPEGYVVF